MGLPRYIVLKSQRNHKYLIHLRDVNDYLQFSGTDFGNLNAKYEVVASSRKDDELVHLKCCYNQMYWVYRPHQSRISADAPEMEEDQTKRSCTLFKPVYFTDTRIGFCHVNMKQNVMLSDQRHIAFSDHDHIYLTVGTPSYQGNYLDFYDWEKLPILPRFIALKDDKNYLSAYKAPQLHDKVPKFVTDVVESDSPWATAAIVTNQLATTAYVVNHIIKAMDDPNVYLGFNCKDKGEQTVGNEVFITPDRKIRLKSNHTGKFWRRSNDNWIWPDSEDETNNDPNTLFEVVNVSKNKIALRNLGNKMFCRSFSADGKNDCLNASSTTYPETAVFTVEELVHKRNIFNVKFHEKDKRNYEKEIDSDVTTTDVNNTGADFEATIKFEYTKVESRTWTTSNELKQTAEVKITAGYPDVVGGELRYAREVTETVTDGKTLNKEKKTEFTRKVTVQPNFKVVATFRVTHALCEIPYSYSQTETLIDGTTGDTQHRDDGLYTSVHTKLHYNPIQEKI